MKKTSALMWQFLIAALLASILFACADSGDDSSDVDDGDVQDGDILDGDTGDGDTTDGTIDSATGDETLRGYFCETDADCAVFERCIPFSDQSAKICQPESFIRFTDEQTFIIDTSDMSVSFDLLDSGEDAITAKGFDRFSEPGNPDLPSLSFNMLLPPDADLGSLSLEILGIESNEVVGEYAIGPAGPALWKPDFENMTFEDWLAQRPYIVDGYNTRIYGENAYWPTSEIKLEDSAQMRKWKFVRIAFFPFQYNPTTGKLMKVEYARVHVSAPVARKAQLSGPQYRALMADRVMDDLAENMFANFHSASGNYEAPAFKDDVPKSDYLIMTTNTIRDKSNKLDAFIAHKKSIGYSVLVITEDDYGTLDGVDMAEKARNWLKREYASRGIQYLLIVADPNDTDNGPGMRVCWPRFNKEDKRDNWEKTATDAYYGDLTGNWNKDGDDNWCEYGSSDGDTGSGGLDLVPELYVGRIPVYSSNTSDLDSILEMTMAYELETDISWRRKVLLPNPISDFSHEIDHGDNGEDEEVNRGHTVDGAKFADRMIRDFLNSRNKVEPFTLYDTRGPEPSKFTPDREFSENAVCEEWAKGYGITSWWAHGNSSSAAGKTWLEDKNNDGIADRSEKNWEDFAHNSMPARCFNRQRPTQTSQVSCLNHRPDGSNNLGYYLLKMGGAVTTMGATSVTLYSPSWYGPNQRIMDNVSMGYFYTDYLVKNYSAGQALGMIRGKPTSFGWGDGTLMNMLSFNVYGDPSLAVFRTFETADSATSDIFENKGHAFDADADSSLRWDLYYRVSDQASGNLDVTIALYDASGSPLKDGGDPIVLERRHSVGNQALSFDGDSPDRYELALEELAFLGAGNHELQYAISFEFDGESIFEGEMKKFEISIEEEDDPVSELTNGSASGRLDDANLEDVYHFTLDAKTTLNVVLDGPNSGADFDLYIKKGSIPTNNDYDDRGYTASADESITIEDAATGDYYILVQRYSGDGSYTLTVSEVNDGPAERAYTPDEIASGTLADGEQRLYKMDVESDGSLFLLLEYSSGADIRVYLRESQPPTDVIHDAAGESDGDSQYLETDVDAGTHYILLDAVRGGDYQFIASVN